MYPQAVYDVPNLFKSIKTMNGNPMSPTTEIVRLLEQVVCARRQVMFELSRSNTCKIGMNTNENKLYHGNKLIGLDKLNMSFVQLKKQMKIQFIKFETTGIPVTYCP